jgi:hypothetical protein
MFGNWYARAILNGGASSGEAAASMPAGALGIWYADDYDAATNAVPNSALSNAPVANIFRGSRRLFANDVMWNSGLVTATDDAVTDPDGGTEASTVVGTGAWLLISRATDGLSAGTYTVAINAKRNTGTDQPFAFLVDGQGRSPVKTATSAWQRFSYTFTIDGSFGVNSIQLASSDGATDANLQIIDFELFAGAADLGPVGADGNLYLGRSSETASPSVASNVIDMTGQGFGTILLPASHSTSEVTAMAMVSKTAAGSGFDGFLSAIQSFTAMTALAGTTKPATYIDGGPGAMDNEAGLWDLLNVGYHLITARCTGTQKQIWLDDILLVSLDASISAFTIRDFFVGIVVNTGLYSGLKLNSLALYDTSLTDTEIRTAYAALVAKAEANGLTVANTSRILVAEGDSITAGPDPSAYPFRFGANASPAVLGTSLAVGGSGIAGMVTRAATLSLPAAPGRDCILSVLIGRADLVGYSGGTSAWLAALAAYCDARRTEGWTVVVCTLLPSTLSGFNTERAIANTEIRLWDTGGSTVAGIHADAICDFAADVTMGPDAAASDTTYYSDGTHPTAAGQVALELVYRATINAL